MKPTFPSLTIFVALAAALRGFADPEPPTPPVLPAPPAAPVPFVAPVPPLPPRDILLAQGPEAIFEEFVEPHVERALSMVTASRRGNVAGRSLVVPGNAAEAEQLREMEEDLNVMARVLEKSTSPRSEEGESRRAMGIELQSLFSSSSAPRNLYLDGYGALFVLRVNFPLLAPPKKEEDENTATKESTSSAWEEARADLYGDRRSEPFGRGLRGGEEFDEHKVESLKDSLIEALKHAAHIRHLKAGETITLVVAGASGRVEGGKRVAAAGFGGMWKRDVFKQVETGRPGAERGGSTLLLRVKKSDADAFANDKLTNEEFRKKATILIY